MPNIKHRESNKGPNGSTPEYRAWMGMKARCYLKTRKDFSSYGGRGIAVCDQWRDDFTAFLAAVGRRPSPAYSLDRYPDQNGNYEPGNVRWATSSEQAINRRPRRVARAAELDGGKTAAEIAAASGLRKATVQDRYRRGYRGADLYAASLADAKSEKLSAWARNKFSQMSSERRVELARIAATARWSRPTLTALIASEPKS